jgi:hypothetical protein
MPWENDCAVSEWHDSCTIRAYFDGMVQPSRLGADLRVTLPADYRHDIAIVASDNDEDPEYLNRGNVCVEKLNASAEVLLERGVALVGFASDAKPAPTCPAEIEQACIAAGWASDCGCEERFGRLAVATDPTGAADVTIDLPPTLWARATLENLGDVQAPTGEHCDATIDVPGAVLTPADPDRPWRASAEIGDPGPQAATEGGFGVEVTSHQCIEVVRTEDPEDFSGPFNGEAQHRSERGNLAICSGCLQDLDLCDRLDELGMAGGQPPG